MRAHSGCGRPGSGVNGGVNSLRSSATSSSAAGTGHVMPTTVEDANIKLDSIISDIVGLSGRRMIEAVISGETNPAKLAELTHRRLRVTPQQLCDALRGRVTKHHRFMLALHLRQIDTINATVAQIDQEVDAEFVPFRDAVRLLSTIPGVGDLGARVIVSEMGTDMSRFPTAGHLISWAGLCPKNDESTGKRRSTWLRKDAPWLKTTLVQCAWAGARKKASYLQAQFHRLRSRRGAKKAVCAVAASMLTAAYHMLKDGTEYHDLGADYFGKRTKATNTKHLVSGWKTSASPSHSPQLRPDLRLCFLLAERRCRTNGNRSGGSGWSWGASSPGRSDVELLYVTS